MNKLMKALLIFVLTSILFILVVASMTNSDDQKQRKICVEKYGGLIEYPGYCSYVRDGDSKSIKLEDIKLGYLEVKE